MSSNISDEQLSQFLAFTGTADSNVARQYLEMSGNQLEMAVSLFMDHNNGTANNNNDNNNNDYMGQQQEVRAPDATRSMRLVGGPPSPGNNPHGDAAAHAALMAAVAGPNAAQQFQMMMGGGDGLDPMEDVMASTWASRDLRETVNRAAAAASASGSRRHRSSSGSGRGNNNNPNRNNDGEENAARRRRTGSRSHSSSSRNNNNNDDEVQVVDQDGNNVGEVMEESDDDSYHYNYDDNSDDDDDSMGAEPITNNHRSSNPPSLSTMFLPPTHLLHRAGGFLGAKNFAKDARRWLLVNIQTEDDFACHALNRDVWRDETVENVVREGFVFVQYNTSMAEGQTYITRYKVGGYPHIGIIDPRTGALLYRKEGWTQVNPMTAEQFVESAMDFCSRHSFDRLPMPARHGYAASSGGGGSGGLESGSSGGVRQRPVHELSEQEQLEAAIRASMEDNHQNDDDDDEVQVLENDKEDEGFVGKSIEEDSVTKSDDSSSNNNNKTEEEEEEQSTPASTFETELQTMEVPPEPTTTGPEIAKLALRMPNGKRVMRKFHKDSSVKVLYAYVAQLDSIKEEAAGREFELKAKFPPVDLREFVEESIGSVGLHGEAVTFMWK